MNRNRILGIFTALFIGALYLGACQNNVNTTLEDSVAPYLELEAIQEASNTTMTVNRGEARGLDSYFALDVSNIQSHGLVTEGITEGWCLNWEKPLRQNNDVHTGLEMYSTFNNSSWKPANYLMSIKNELKASDPELTYREIQIALWSVIKTPSFDLDEVLSNDRMPQRMMRNGEPNFDVDKVKQIVNRVNNEVSEFTYKLGTPVIAYSHHSNDETQQPVGTLLGGTAWGLSSNNPDKVKNFCSEPWEGEEMPERWGWSNGQYNAGEEDTLDMYVGAAHCDIDRGDFVGTFYFEYNEDGYVDYKLDLTEKNDLANLHFYIGEEVLPRNKGNDNLHPAPGQLGYKVELNPGSNDGVNLYEGTVSGISGPIYIAVHLGDTEEDED